MKWRAFRAVRALEKADFNISNQGKHIVMTDGTRIITVPRSNPINEIQGPVSLRRWPYDRAVQEVGLIRTGQLTPRCSGQSARIGFGNARGNLIELTCRNERDVPKSPSVNMFHISC